MQRVSRQEIERQIAALVDRLRPYGPQRIVLFGSLARGDYHALSDIDLLIVKDTPVPFVERIGPVIALCAGEGPLPVEPLVYTPAELEQLQAGGNSFVERALAEGVTIYEQ